MNFVKSKYFLWFIAVLPFAIMIMYCYFQLIDNNPYDQLNLGLLCLFIICGGLYYGFFEERETPFRVIIWCLWIFLLSIFPIIIETLRNYDENMGFINNLDHKLLESIKQNNFYSIPFALLMAAYTDLLFRENKDNSIIGRKIHLITWILVLVIIFLAWFDNYFIDSEYVIDKTKLNSKNIFILLHFHFIGWLAVYVIYLKTLSLKK